LTSAVAKRRGGAVSSLAAITSIAVATLLETGAILGCGPAAPDGDKRHTLQQTARVKPFRWGAAKNEQLKAERGVSFERMVVAIEGDGLLDILAHAKPGKHSHQRVLVVACDGYAYLVPFVEQGDHHFLKTVIPSRKATQDYLSAEVPDAEEV
jgi:uncharacterized DUF497 family protein